jgi:hypothetical protein
MPLMYIRVGSVMANDLFPFNSSAQPTGNREILLDHVMPGDQGAGELRNPEGG